MYTVALAGKGSEPTQRQDHAFLRSPGAIMTKRVSMGGTTYQIKNRKEKKTEKKH